jgi:Tfp pilus assembly protein PilF
MKKYFSIIFFLAGIGAFPAHSQKAPANQAEMEAFMKNLQRQSDSIKQVLKKKGINIESPQKIPASSPPASKDPIANNKAIDKIELPPRDSLKVRNIPKKNFSLQELAVYLVDVHAQLAQRMPGPAASAKAIAVKLNNDPAKMESAAIVAWKRGAGEEAALLVTDGASRAINDGLLLTNAGAILDMNGMGDKAIPILRTVVTYDPDNAIALNNLGQAFVQLGMMDSGMTYLGRCIQKSPQHPEANNTAGHIELKKGNKGKAQTYFENSIRGGYTPAAYKGIRAIDKNYKIANLIRPKVKLTEYFNQFKYKLPLQCRKVEDALVLKIEHKQYRELMNLLAKKYEQLRREAEKEFNSTSVQRMQQRAIRGENIIKPFMGLAGTMHSETWLEFTKEIYEVDQFSRENRAQYKQLELEYRAEYEKVMQPFNERAESNCCGEGDVSCCPENKEVCDALNKLKNKYLVKFADINDEWQERNIGLFRKYYDELIFWNYLSSWDEIEFKIRFFDLTQKYFQAMSRVCETKILEPCVSPEPEDKEKPVETELKQFDCPVEIEIPFLVGSFEMDCEKISFGAGEFIKFKYEKMLTGSRQSTMSVGVGFELYKFEVGAFGVKAGAKAEAGMSVFLVFDGGNHVCDGGVQYGAKAAAGIDFSSGEKVKLKKELFSKQIGVGWRAALNAGVSFN